MFSSKIMIWDGIYQSNSCFPRKTNIYDSLCNYLISSWFHVPQSVAPHNQRTKPVRAQVLLNLFRQQHVPMCSLKTRLGLHLLVRMAFLILQTKSRISAESVHYIEARLHLVRLHLEAYFLQPAFLKGLALFASKGVSLVKVTVSKHRCWHL